MFASAGLRELFYCRNPGDARMKVRSDREAATSPMSPSFGLDEIGALAIQIMSAGTLQNWPCQRGMYSNKALREHVGFSVEIALLLAKEQYFE